MFQSIPPFYNPQFKSSALYEDYNKQLNLKSEHEKRLRENKKLSYEHLKSLIEKFNNQFNTDEYMSIQSFRGDTVVNPIKELYATLNPTSWFPTLESAKKDLIYCINALKFATIPRCFEHNFLRWNPLVEKAKAYGNLLERKFKVYIDQLDLLIKEQKPYEDDLENVNNNVKHPKEVIRNNLNNALIHALDNMAEYATAYDKKHRDSSMWGVRGVCNEYMSMVSRGADIYDQSLNNRCNNYRPLEIQTAETVKQLTMLQKILDAHSKNLKLLDTMQENDLRQLLQPANAPVSKAQKLVDQLKHYLTQRENVKESNGTTKEYFYNCFFSFQKSFTQKRTAVQSLIAIIEGDDAVDIQDHLSTLRNGQLGKVIRSFVKAGQADEIVGKKVTTVSELVTALSELQYQRQQLSI